MGKRKNKQINKEIKEHDGSASGQSKGAQADLQRKQSGHSANRKKGIIIMNKQTTFNVTLMDNRYGDNIRSAKITWEQFTDRIKNPPTYQTKGKDGIIGGKCEWEDGVATRTVNKWEYIYDSEGEIATDEKGNKMRQCVPKTEVMKDRRGVPIKRAKNGTRKVIDRQLMFIDCDSIDDVDKWINDVYMYKEFWGWAFAIYSSFSATEDKPRYRVVFPMNRPVTPEEYKRIARAIMVDLDEMNCDPCSDRANQIMFLPAWPKVQDPETEEWENGYYEYIIEDGGDPMNVDEFLSYLVVSGEVYDNYKAPVRTKTGEPVERIIKKVHNSKPDFDIYPEGDPRNKNNIVGDFCREYSISEAIEEFDLPYDYVSENTYKLRDSKSPPGAFVKDDDTLFYSYHQTDPACGRDRNAWDLVMIHNFDGDYVQMCAFAREKLNKPHD